MRLPIFYNVRITMMSGSVTGAWIHEDDFVAMIDPDNLSRDEMITVSTYTVCSEIDEDNCTRVVKADRVLNLRMSRIESIKEYDHVYGELVDAL